MPTYKHPSGERQIVVEGTVAHAQVHDRDGWTLVDDDPDPETPAAAEDEPAAAGRPPARRRPTQPPTEPAGEAGTKTEEG